MSNNQSEESMTDDLAALFVDKLVKKHRLGNDVSSDEDLNQLLAMIDQDHFVATQRDLVADLCFEGNISALEKFEHFDLFTEADYEKVFHKLRNISSNTNAIAGYKWLANKLDSVNDWETDEFVIESERCKLSWPCQHRVKSKKDADAKWTWMDGYELCQLIHKEGRKNLHFEEYKTN